MKQALSFAKEILRKQEAISRSNRVTLKRDYYKSIKQDTKDLKYYCSIKGLDYRQVMEWAGQEKS